MNKQDKELRKIYHENMNPRKTKSKCKLWIIVIIVSILLNVWSIWQLKNLYERIDTLEIQNFDRGLK